MIHKTTRSILSVLLVALLLVTSVPLTPAFADGGAVSPQSANSERGGLEGSGKEGDPYQIATADDLLKFAKLVNDGETTAWAVLTADIVLNEKIEVDDNGAVTNQKELSEWTPIGNIIDEEDLDSFGYTGTFDGNGHTISGLYINRSADYQGLFGYVSSGGIVQNLSVTGNVSGGWYVGGVVGLNLGSVENCYNTGSVSGDYYVGGVVGENRGSGGSVINCYNTGAVNSSGNYVGGVVGQNSSSGTVKNCYNTGSVSGSYFVGGVVGCNISASVTDCYNTGSVKGPDSVSGSYVGGVVGYNISSVTNCYFLKTDDVNKDLPGIGANLGSGSATAKDNTAFHSGEVAYLLQNGQTAGVGGVVPLVWGQSKLGETTSLPTLNPTDEQKVYQVTFDYGDSFAEADDRYDYHYANANDAVTLPTSTDQIPSYDGHTLTGWQDADKNPVTGQTVTITADTEFTAQWTANTYSITASPSTLNFGSITEGEERPAAQTVTVKNTGNQRVTLVQPTATNFEITTSDNLTLNAGESVTLTIQPKANLPRGSYSEQITITGDNNVSETLTATFTVKEPPYTGKYSYEVFTSVGDNGAISVDRYATEGEKVTITVTPDEAYKLDDLSVTAHGKDVELTANGDGTYSFTMPSADVKITATFAEDPDWTEPEEPATDVSDLFIDIAPDAWYKDAVQYAYDNGLMTGVSATEFAPEATTTRAMIVSILARLENVTTAEAAGFADVDDNDWYATAVSWAANVGVVNGYEDNTFRPNTAITREQLAAILMNYAAYKGEDVSNRADLTSYTDQPSTWATETMSWAVAEGLISGVTADTLQPQGAATRAQVAAILQRFLSE